MKNGGAGPASLLDAGGSGGGVELIQPLGEPLVGTEHYQAHDSVELDEVGHWSRTQNGPILGGSQRTPPAPVLSQQQSLDTLVAPARRHTCTGVGSYHSGHAGVLREGLLAQPI